eukprot:148223_1
MAQENKQNKNPYLDENLMTELQQFTPQQNTQFVASHQDNSTTHLSTSNLTFNTVDFTNTTNTSDENTANNTSNNNDTFTWQSDQSMHVDLDFAAHATVVTSTNNKPKPFFMNINTEEKPQPYVHSLKNNFNNDTITYNDN